MAIERIDYQFIYHRIGDQKVRFEISEEDIAGDPSYFGYLNENGAWIIQKRNAADGTYRYAIGAANYATNWTGRAGLSYVYYSQL